MNEQYGMTKKPTKTTDGARSIHTRDWSCVWKHEPEVETVLELGTVGG